MVGTRNSVLLESLVLPTYELQMNANFTFIQYFCFKYFHTFL